MKQILLILSIPLISLSVLANKPHILEPETQEVIDTFKGQTISAIYNFCEEKMYASTCSQLIQFKETKSFIYNFASLERQVAATVYYIEKANGRFKNVLDEIPDGIIGIDKAFAYNSDLRVLFDADGMPNVKDVRVVRHGTTQFTISDFTISHNGLRYDGSYYDSAKPEWEIPYTLRYSRVGLPIFNPSDDLPVVVHIKKLFEEPI